jgi:diadenosine tetraphosphate (Ap4A) HIT family hydrolase
MFDLHPRLIAETVTVVDWPLCRVLLMNDAAYPWLVLVPRQKDIAEITDLSPEDQLVLMGEIAKASTALRALVSPHRINVAALGNMVAQLHVHVIARFTDDPAWPKAVWGAVPCVNYTADALAAKLTELRSVLG